MQHPHGFWRLFQGMARVWRRLEPLCAHSMQCPNAVHAKACCAGLEHVEHGTLYCCVAHCPPALQGAGHEVAADRDVATAAAAALCVSRGAAVIRAHNVAAVRDAVRVADAFRAAAGGGHHCSL